MLTYTQTKKYNTNYTNCINECFKWILYMGSMFQELGGLYGVSERGGVSWVQGSHSLGEKAVEQSGGAGSDAPVRLPDGRSWKRLWEGWVGSFTIIFALLEHRARKISRMEGRGAAMIFAAVFTVCWRVLRSAALEFPYQTVMQVVSTLSMVPL